MNYSRQSNNELHINGFVQRAIEIAFILEDERLQIGKFKMKKMELMHLMRSLKEIYSFDAIEMELINGLLCICKSMEDYCSSTLLGQFKQNDRRWLGYSNTILLALKTLEIQHDIKR